MSINCKISKVTPALPLCLSSKNKTVFLYSICGKYLVPTTFEKFITYFKNG
jgi:hypothetical protein